MTYECTTLPNGLRVASEYLPDAKSVAVAVSVGVGRRYEGKDEKGISHMLEHMIFKGTKTRSNMDILRAFDNIGANPNAFTSQDTTVYHAKTVPEHAGELVEILSDVVQHSTCDPKELKREKGTVIEEILADKDDPQAIITDQFNARAFPGQPLGETILGTEKSVRSFTQGDFQRHMKKYYQPENMVYSAAGNIRHEDFVRMVETFYTQTQAPSTKPGTGVPSRQKTFDPAVYRGGDKRVSRELEQTHLILGLPTVSRESPQYPALKVYAQILGGGMSSRLFEEIREKRGLAYTVQADVEDFDEMGLIEIYSAASTPKKTQALSRVLCEQIAAMADDISDEELARAKNQLRINLIMSSESTENIATRIGGQLLDLGAYEPIEETIRKTSAVTKEDVLTLAAQIAEGTPTLVALGATENVLPYDKIQQILQTHSPRTHDASASRK